MPVGMKAPVCPVSDVPMPNVSGGLPAPLYCVLPFSAFWPLPICTSPCVVCRRQSIPRLSSESSLMSMIVTLISTMRGRSSSWPISDW